MIEELSLRTYFLYHSVQIFFRALNGGCREGVGFSYLLFRLDHKFLDIRTILFLQ